MRVRVTFAKTEAMRFTSHLDLHRAWERTFRRAGLPLAYTQGFRPHPRLNLASALPLGFTSEGEVMDAWLEQTLPFLDIQKILEQTLPPGLKVVAIQEIDLRAPSLQAELEASEFAITLLEPSPDLSSRLEVSLAAEHLDRQWRQKSYDLRPLILGLYVQPDDNQGRQRFLARLMAREGATGRPDEVVAVLGLLPGRVRVHRSRLIFRQDIWVGYNNLYVDEWGKIYVLLDSFDGEEGRFLSSVHHKDNITAHTQIRKFKNMTSLDEYLQDLVYRYEPNKNL